MLSALVHLLIYIIVLGLIIGLLLWLVDNIPLPEPFNRVVRIAIIAIGVIILILLLLSLVEGGGVPRIRLG